MSVSSLILKPQSCLLSLAKSLPLKCIMVTSYLPLYAGITNEALYSRFPFLLVSGFTLLYLLVVFLSSHLNH